MGTPLPRGGVQKKKSKPAKHFFYCGAHIKKTNVGKDNLFFSLSFDFVVLCHSTTASMCFEDIPKEIAEMKAAGRFMSRDEVVECIARHKEVAEQRKHLSHLPGAPTPKSSYLAVEF